MGVSGRRGVTVQGDTASQSLPYLRSTDCGPGGDCPGGRDPPEGGGEGGEEGRGGDLVEERAELTAELILGCSVEMMELIIPF